MDDSDRTSILTQLPRYEARDPHEPRAQSPAPSYRTLPTFASATSTNNRTESRAPQGFQRWVAQRKRTSVLQKFARIANPGDPKALRDLLRDPSQMKWIEPEKLGEFLHLCLQQVSLTPLLPCLIEYGAALDSSWLDPALATPRNSTNRDTILHTALRTGREPPLYFVLDRIGPGCVADINRRGILNDTPLNICVKKNDAQVAKLLLAKGAKVDIDSLKLVIADKLGFILTTMLEMNKIEASNETRRALKDCHWIFQPLFLATPLIELGLIEPSVRNVALAIRYQNHDLTTKLLRLGASATGHVNMTPVAEVKPYTPIGKISLLTYAVLKRNPTAVRYLIEHGADLEAGDGRGHTALHAAIALLANERALNNREPVELEIVSILLDSGADEAATDKDGNTPFAPIESKPSYNLFNLAYYFVNTGYFKMAQYPASLIKKRLDLKFDAEYPSFIARIEHYSFIMFKLGCLEASESLLVRIKDLMDSGRSFPPDFPIMRKKRKSAADVLKVCKGIQDSKRCGNEWDDEGIKSRIGLVSACTSLGWALEAPKEYLNIVELAEFRFGLHSPITWQAMASLGHVYQVKNQDTEAEDLFRRAFDLSRNRADLCIMERLRPAMYLSLFYLEQGRETAAGRIIRSRCSTRAELGELRSWIQGIVEQVGIETIPVTGLKRMLAAAEHDFNTTVAVMKPFILCTLGH